MRDPSTIPAQTRWVADYIAKNGPGALKHWRGYRGPRDADPRWGDSGYKPDSSLAETAAKYKGLVIHHTGGRGTVDGVVNTLKQRGLGVQYVMDRDGNIHATGMRGKHIRPAEDGSGLNNSNALGIEIIAKNDRDVTRAQIEAAKRFAAEQSKRYGFSRDMIKGHGEINSHKQHTEGSSVVDAIRSDPNFGKEAYANRAGPDVAWPLGWAKGGAQAGVAKGDRSMAPSGEWFGRAMTQTGSSPQKVEGEAALKVRFENMPRGAKVDSDMSGMFRSISIDRGRSMQAPQEV